MVGRPPDSEHALVERARRGDVIAYESLVRAHQDIAFRIAWLVTQSAAEAEDAAQEAFLKAWRALPRFRPQAPFRPWLLTIVANEARNRRRATGRRAGLALRAAREHEVAPPAAVAPSPEAILLAGDERDELRAVVATLDVRDREVLTCRYLLGLSEQETAAVLGWRRGTVKSRSARALARLRTRLAAPEEGVLTG